MKSHKVDRYLALFVSGITFVVYLTSLRNDFLEWDDIEYIVDNLRIRSMDLDFFKWSLSSFDASNWHPLTWISHAIDYAIWGLNPLGHHLTNVMLHSLNTFMVFVVTGGLLKAWTNSTPEQQAGMSDRWMLIASSITALLFGLHPLHVESVAWVAERKDLLCALFFLLSITMYMKYVRTVPEWEDRSTIASRLLKRYYLFSLGLFLLALLSKPMAVTLPFVLLILDWHPFGKIRSLKTFGKAFLEKLPFFSLSVCSSILTVLAQKETMSSLKVHPPATRLLVGTKSLIDYLWHMLFPVNLLPYYAYPRDVSILSLKYIFPILLAGGMTACFLAMAKKQKIWLAAWLFYLATLMPVIGIVQVGRQAMADRYTYLPSLGPFLIAGIVSAWGFHKADTSPMLGKKASKFLIIAPLIVCIAMSYTTVQQIGVWKNSIVLWNFVINNSPVKDALPYTNRGITFIKIGQSEKGIEDFNRALELDPAYDQAFLSRGFIYLVLGQFDRAIADFDKVIILNPYEPQAYSNRGIALSEKGQMSRAVEDFKKALELHPGTVKYLFNLGNAYLQLGNRQEAIAFFNKTIVLDPYDHIAYSNRGAAFSDLGQLNRAIEDFMKALELHPDDAKYLFNLGNAYLRQKRFQEAIQEFKTALGLKPDYVDAHTNLGIAYTEQGRIQEAIQEFQEVLRLIPGDAETVRKLEILNQKVKR